MIQCAAANPSAAGALRITPTSIDVQPDSQFCSVTVTNDRDQPVSIQVRGFGWSQNAAGDEVLDSDAAVVVNPAIFTLPPAQSRMVRCAVPAPGGAATEGSWRLIIDELPGPPTKDTSAIRALLRLSVPVFRTPDGAKPALEVIPITADGDVKRYRLRNAGSAHVKVLDLKLGQGVDEQRLEQSFYLLAGAQREIAMPRPNLSPTPNIWAATVQGDLPVTVAGGSALASASAR